MGSHDREFPIPGKDARDPPRYDDAIARDSPMDDATPDLRFYPEGCLSSLFLFVRGDPEGLWIVTRGFFFCVDVREFNCFVFFICFKKNIINRYQVISVYFAL